MTWDPRPLLGRDDRPMAERLADPRVRIGYDFSEGEEGSER